MKEWIDKTIAKRVWLVLVFHGVDGIGWEALPEESFVEYFDYIKVNEAQLWIATFQDAFKYIRERMHSKVDTKTTSDAITITLSNDLDNRIYDLDLTLKTQVPSAWKSVNVQQGDIQKTIIAQRDGDMAFVEYRAMPNSAKIIISKNNGHLK